MALNNTTTVNDILNRVAAEVGDAPINDPYGSTDPLFVKLRYFLITAGEELMQAFKWELLIREHQIVTQDGDTGEYELPDDFGHMINQTNWEHSNRVPVAALSNQEWAYLKGRNFRQ